MRQQRVLDFGRRNVLAAPPDHLLEPPGQEDIALLVAVAGIAGVQPAIFDGGRRDRGRVPVPGGRHRFAEAQLASLAGLDNATIAIDDPQLALEGSGRWLPGTPDATGLHARAQ